MEDQEENNTKKSLETEINTEKSSFCECVDCKSQIAEGARKCSVCHSFQNQSRHLLSLAPALSLIVAIIALLPSSVNLVVSVLSDKTPKYSVLSFYADNIADPNGIIPRPIDFSINAQITNLAEQTLIVDYKLWCSIREGVAIPEKSISSNADEPFVIIPALAGFDLYLENKEKTVVPALSTQTISWNVTDDKYVELKSWRKSEHEAKTQHSVRNLEQFYNSILSEFSDAKTLQSEDSFPRGVEIRNGSINSFFLNLDCSFVLENSSSNKGEELHLEFVYEFSGDSGIFPRWRIGKNIGDGFGNGAGS